MDRTPSVETRPIRRQRIKTGRPGVRGATTNTGSRPHLAGIVVEALARQFVGAPCLAGQFVKPDHRTGALAAEVGLSPSRLQHLFKECTGLPLHRFRIWNRMGAAITAVSAGASLTVAAHRAGFSSSAHFSKAFRAMFGLCPSDLVAAGLRRHPH